MLRTLNKIKQEDGFYITGIYELAIVPIIDDVINFDFIQRRYTFTPNPSDIDDDTQISNTIQPDQGSGFYINLNTVGVKNINIRGTTGQFYNNKNAFDTIGGNAGSAIKAVSGLLGIKKYPNGYDRFIELQNFFAHWYSQVENKPFGIAMMFVNHKDAEFYQVVPTGFRKIRTSAKPLHYGYSINLRVIDEHKPSGGFLRGQSWLDKYNSTRNKITRWRQAVNQTIVLSSYITQQTLASFISSDVIPANDVINSTNLMVDNLQGIVYSADMLSSGGANTASRFKSIAETVYGPGSEKNTILNVSGKKKEPLPRAAKNVVPPTRSNLGKAYSPTKSILESATNQLSSNMSNEAVTYLDIRNPYIYQFGAAIELRMQAILATETSPVSDYTPVENSSEISRHMHQAGRSGSTGYLSGRENELTSASLAADTQFIDGVRHPIGTVNESLQSYSLSYLASSILPSWAKDNDRKLSPELNSFRKSFLGMRDPSTLSPVYKTITVGDFDSVYSIASRYLGSWERWFEIVLINGLEYPYISKNGGLSCKTPGDQIIVPIEEVNIPLDVIEKIKNITLVHDRVKEQDAFLGFDIELDSNGDSIFGAHDFLHVAGIKAFEQEMRFILEGSGGISTDRSPGPNIKIGIKSKGGNTLSIIKSTLKQWLSADPRVDELISINAIQSGGLIQTYMNIKFKNWDSSIVVAGELRSA